MRRVYLAGNGVVRVAALAGLGLVQSACVIAPGIPGGPLQGRGVQFGPSWGVSAAPGTAVTTSQTGEVDREAAPELSLGAPIPARLGARLGVADWMDLAADVGWNDTGAELRLGVPEWSTSTPYAVSLAHRLTFVPVGPSDELPREWRLRGELYPELSWSESARWHWVTALGASVGNRLQRGLYADRNSQPAAFGSGLRRFVREETRAEAAFGVEMRRDVVRVAAVGMPYWVVHHGNTANEDVVRLERSFGFTLLVDLAFSFAFQSTETKRRKADRARGRTED